MILLTALLALAAPAVAQTGTATATPTPTPTPTPTEWFTSLYLTSYGEGAVTFRYGTSAPFPPEASEFVWTDFVQSPPGNGWSSSVQEQAYSLRTIFIGCAIGSLVLAMILYVPVVVWYRDRVKHEINRDIEGAKLPAYRPRRASGGSTASRQLVAGAAGAAGAAAALPRAAASPAAPRAWVETTMTLYSYYRTTFYAEETSTAVGTVTTTVRVPDRTTTRYLYKENPYYIQAVRDKKMWTGLIVAIWTVPFLIAAVLLLHWFIKVRRWRKKQRAEQAIHLEELTGAKPPDYEQ